MPVDRTIPTQDRTNLATFRITVNGDELSEEVGISTITVTKSVNRIPKATIVLFDGSLAKEDFKLSNEETFKPGNEVEIKSGYHTIEDPIFKGIIIKHGIEAKTNQPSKLILELRDVSVKMTVGRKNRYFEEVTDSDIIEEILSEYSGVNSEVEGTQANHLEMVQYYSTDWDFILSRAEMNGQLVFVDDGKVTVKAPTMSDDPLLNLHYGDNIFEFEADMDARDQIASTLGKSWNYTDQELSELEGTDSDLDQHGNISGSDLASVIGLESWDMQHNGQVMDEELQAWADARLMRSRLSKIKGRLKIIGFSDIKPGHIVDLGGLGERFNGKAFVSGVYHEIMPNSKWYTFLEIGLDKQWFAETYNDIVDKPASGLLPAIHGLHQGIVTNIHEDPDGEGRVKVRLPIISPEATGVWARVARIDAGDSRGLFFHPEVDDEVVVGFFNDDPRDPVILGLMHSSGKPEPYEISEDNFEKGVITKEELKLTFNDDLKSITLETPNGNKVVLSDDEGSITLEDENGNSVKLNSDGVTIDSAGDVIINASGDIKVSGTNVELSANSQFKAEGSGGAELSTSAQAVVKGSIVQIN